jgi:four helix bundle protein
MSTELRIPNFEARMIFETPLVMTAIPPGDTDGSSGREYDLEERTARFGEAVIAFAKLIPVNKVTEPIIGQLVRAATSIGANYCEADDAGSRREFMYRISICKRESRESKHWLWMTAAAASELKVETRVQWQEAKELHLIFAAIYRGKSKD